MTKTDNEPGAGRGELLVNSLLETARSSQMPVPDTPPQLISRVLSDAYEVQTEFASCAIVETADAERGAAESVLRLLHQIGRTIGGAPSYAGLIAVSLLGLWVGATSPVGLDPLAALSTGASDALYDPVPGFGLGLEEG